MATRFSEWELCLDSWVFLTTQKLFNFFSVRLVDKRLLSITLTKSELHDE